METTNYPEPVAKLLTYDEPDGAHYNEWPNYLKETGIGPEHIPDLLRMIDDKGLRTTDLDEDDPKYWGPVHAWRTLGQLGDPSVVKPLLDRSKELCDFKAFGDWAIDELPEVYGFIGKDAIPILVKCIADPTNDEDTRVNASTGLEKITEIHPETKEDCIQALTQQLENFEENPYELNASLISGLAHMGVREALPLIEQAFEAKKVDDLFINLDDVLILLGLKERPEYPPMDLNTLFQSAAHTEAETLNPYKVISPKPQKPPKSQPSPMTKKAKAKMEKASRKKNRST